MLHHSLIFESTGLTDAFDHMLHRLRQDLRVYLIGISTELGECLQRVKTRDASMHVDVSDAMVNTINAQVTGKNFIFDGVIENTHATTDELLTQFDNVLRNIKYNQPSVN